MHFGRWLPLAPFENLPYKNMFAVHKGRLKNVSSSNVQSFLLQKHLHRVNDIMHHYKV